MHFEQASIDQVQGCDPHGLMRPAAQISDVHVIIEHGARRHVSFAATAQEPKHAQRREAEDEIEEQEFWTAEVEGIHELDDSAAARR